MNKDIWRSFEDHFTAINVKFPQESNYLLKAVAASVLTLAEEVDLVGEALIGAAIKGKKR